MYLLVITLAQSFSFFVSNFQPSFAIKTIFRLFIFLIPNPLCCLHFVTMSQLIRWVLLFSFVSPQRNFLTFISIILHNPIGKRVVCIWKIMIELITYCTKVCLPVKDRYRIFQLSILEEILSRRFWYRLVLTFSGIEGVLRYLPTLVGDSYYLCYFIGNFLKHCFGEANVRFLETKFLP